MPIDQTLTLSIACDNPDCPGHDLAHDSRDGWLFVNHEVYGEPSRSSVYCSVSCVSTHTTALAQESPAIW